MIEFRNLKIGVLILFFGIGSFCFGQSKQELMKSIIQVNELQSECVGDGCNGKTQYHVFQKLKNLLSDNELYSLTKNENAVLRTYAILDFIDSGKGNIPELFAQELNNNEEIRTFEGCIRSTDLIYSEVYHAYWNKLRIDIKDENEEILALKNDKTLQKLDSLVVYYPKDIYWLIYNRAFENRKYDESYLPRIKELALEKNNSYAFDYLNKYYSERFSAEFSNYFKNDFPKAKFETENEIFYLHGFLEYLFESGNEEYKQIAVSKLKNDNSWRKNNSSWFKNKFEKYAPGIF